MAGRRARSPATEDARSVEARHARRDGLFRLNRSDLTDWMRSRNTTPSRWSNSCWKARASKPDAVSVIGAPSGDIPSTTACSYRCTLPVYSGTLRHPSRTIRARSWRTRSGLRSTTNPCARARLPRDVHDDDPDRAGDVRRRERHPGRRPQGIQQIPDDRGDLGILRPHGRGRGLNRGRSGYTKIGRTATEVRAGRSRACGTSRPRRGWV